MTPAGSLAGTFRHVISASDVPPNREAICYRDAHEPSSARVAAGRGPCGSAPRALTNLEACPEGEVFVTALVVIDPVRLV
jgi:hypothetical protein